MSYHQKIECNVVSCAHNCLEDCTCRLDRIIVKPCQSDNLKKGEIQCTCASYNFVGEMNVARSIGRGDPVGSNQQ